MGALHVIELLLEDAISFVIDELGISWPETARDRCTRHWDQFEIDLANEGWSLIKPCLRKTNFRRTSGVLQYTLDTGCQSRRSILAFRLNPVKF